MNTASASDRHQARNTGITHPDFIHAASGFAWPIVALVIVLMLHAPLLIALNSLRTRLSDLHSLKLGSLELDIDEKRLRPPPADVAKALSALSAGDIEKLQHSYKTCNPKHVPSKNLEAAGIVHRESNAECATLDPDLGMRTRNYLFNLVAAEVGRSDELNLKDD